MQTAILCVLIVAACFAILIVNSGRNPKNTAVDLSSLLAQPTDAPDKILAAYTYENAAKKLYAALNSL